MMLYNNKDDDDDDKETTIDILLARSNRITQTIHEINKLLPFLRFQKNIAQNLNAIDDPQEKVLMFESTQWVHGKMNLNAFVSFEAAIEYENLYDGCVLLHHVLKGRRIFLDGKPFIIGSPQQLAHSIEKIGLLFSSGMKHSRLSFIDSSSCFPKAATTTTTKAMPFLGSYVDSNRQKVLEAFASKRDWKKAFVCFLWLNENITQNPLDHETYRWASFIDFVLNVSQQKDRSFEFNDDDGKKDLPSIHSDPLVRYLFRSIPFMDHMNNALFFLLCPRAGKLTAYHLVKSWAEHCVRRKIHQAFSKHDLFIKQDSLEHNEKDQRSTPWRFYVASNKDFSIEMETFDDQMRQACSFATVQGHVFLQVQQPKDHSVCYVIQVPYERLIDEILSRKEADGVCTIDSLRLCFVFGQTVLGLSSFFVKKEGELLSKINRLGRAVQVLQAFFNQHDQ